MPVIDTMLQNEIKQYGRGVEFFVTQVPGLRAVPSIFNKYQVFSYSGAAYSPETGGIFDLGKMFDILPDDTEINELDANLQAINERRRELTAKETANGQLPLTSDKEARISNILREEFGNDAVNRVAYEEIKQYNIPLAPTAKAIIEYSKNLNPDVSIFGPMPYSWSDFLWCKHYGKIPNNHLITLRRYPLPVWDNARVFNGEAAVPIAQAVTWLGEETGNKLSEILPFSWNIKWKDIEASVQDVAGNEKGLGDGPEQLLSGKTIKRAGFALTTLRGSQDRYSGRMEKEQEWRQGAFGQDGPYWNQVLGPVNVINKTTMRDMGLDFKGDIKLKFEYSLRSYGGVNPKVAMLDLIANFLSLTYTNAKFWGGAMRYFPNARPQVMFPGGKGAQDAFYSGDWNGFFTGIKDEFSSYFQGATDFVKNLFSGKLNLGDLLGKLAGGAFNTAMSGMSRKNRPHILSIRNLLTGDPVGEHHLVVGNPMRPIALIGNLVCTECNMTLGDKLGLDDFPTEVTFEVTLKHARPRDKGDIESIFNQGAGRLTYSPMAPLPSESGTFGDAWKGETAPLPDKNAPGNNYGSQQPADKDNAKLDPVEAAKAYDYTKYRVNAEWGKAFTNTNLNWVFNKTKGDF